jgi:hypothetical protein
LTPDAVGGVRPEGLSLVGIYTLSARGNRCEINAAESSTHAGPCGPQVDTQITISGPALRCQRFKSCATS